MTELLGLGGGIALIVAAIYLMAVIIFDVSDTGSRIEHIADKVRSVIEWGLIALVILIVLGLGVIMVISGLGLWG